MKVIKEKKNLIIGILLLCMCLLSALGLLSMKASISASAQETLPTITDGTDLLELTEEQSVDFIQSKGIEIPKEYVGGKETGKFVKTIIASCVEDPDCQFAISYDVTQNFVEKIRAVVKEYYDWDTERETSTVATTASSYTLQDSEVVFDDANVIYYNCYSYAIGKTDDWYLPGAFSGKTFDITRVISEIAQLVASDLEALGYYDVIVSADRPEVDSNAHLICVRKVISNQDFHFMKYENGSWYHKPGGTAILRYKHEPEDKVWTSEGYHDGEYISPIYFYDSQIYYIRYYEEKPDYYDLFNGGSGSVYNPFQINNPTQLYNVGLAYRSVYIEREGNQNQITFAFKLTNDISITADWVPFKYKFSGTFDGNGYSISYNMSLTQMDVDNSANQGLFSVITSGGSVKNLKLKNCTIVSPSQLKISSYPYAGFLAGKLESASGIESVTVQDCTYDCPILNASIGGIAGGNTNTSVTNCIVTGGSLSNTTGYLGGMIGYGSISDIHGGSVTTTLKYSEENQKNGSMTVNDVVGNTSSTGNVSCNVTKESTDGCVTAGTLITLADGSQVPVESLKGDESLLVWNLYTGEYDVAPILFIDRDPAANYKVIELTFSDGTVTEVVSEHGFFDVDLNRYVYLDENAAEYLGHHFFQSDESTVQLVGVDYEYREVAIYSPVTYGHLCYFVNGMLSMPGGIDGLFNIFEVGEDMRYDQEKMAEDIATYGLFTYEEFAQTVPVSESVFEAFNAQYLKVAIGKGIVTVERLGSLVERYQNYLMEL